MTLGQRIAHHRGRLQRSQQELAEQLNVSRQSVSKWETDGSIPELDKLVEMSKIFSLTLDELVTGEEPPVQAQPQSATHPQQSGRTPRETMGQILAIIGISGTALGVFIPILWIVSIPLLLLGTYFVNPDVALTLGWWLICIPLLFMRWVTSCSLGLVFLPYAYTSGKLGVQLIVAYIAWALIILWTVCAWRSKKFEGRKWMAIGWGLMLYCSDRWWSIFYLLTHPQENMWRHYTPLGYVNLIISVAFPIVMIVATILYKKKRK